MCKGEREIEKVCVCVCVCVCFVLSSYTHEKEGFTSLAFLLSFHFLFVLKATLHGPKSCVVVEPTPPPIPTAPHLTFLQLCIVLFLFRQSNKKV